MAQTPCLDLVGSNPEGWCMCVRSTLQWTKSSLPSPLIDPQVARFRRAPVQIKGIETGDSIHSEGWWVCEQHSLVDLREMDLALDEAETKRKRDKKTKGVLWPPFRYLIRRNPPMSPRYCLP
jgi:hypothetical protein